MKKIPRCAFLAIILYFLAVTLGAVPLSAASSQGEPLASTQQTARFESKNLSLKGDTRLAPTGSPPPAPTRVTASAGEYTDKIRVTWGSITLGHQVFIPLLFSSVSSIPAPSPDSLYFQVYRSPTPSTKDATQ